MRFGTAGARPACVPLRSRRSLLTHPGGTPPAGRAAGDIPAAAALPPTPRPVPCTPDAPTAVAADRPDGDPARGTASPTPGHRAPIDEDALAREMEETLASLRHDVRRIAGRSRGDRLKNLLFLDTAIDTMLEDSTKKPEENGSWSWFESWFADDSAVIKFVRG
eukprot:CAMPEP_0194267070 /NCGR_PEP_ID=MMETSP0169-20130528/1737_1 /TAXON_ID=218684 /ORGANISM="Corethron pennatum, Strain L29A3" /LENGTH=163 /DNA_ID=CAMNT_0039007873 /DNA_START=46 /DNA_END=537 /DNA_ORIENTATION=+